MLRFFSAALAIGILTAFPARAFEECRFAFELDTQSSAFQALVDDATLRGGFWRPIHEAPDDVQGIAKFIGRLDYCLRTADGKPAKVTRGGRTFEVPSPFVTSCTAALLPDNRLLTNVHCYYEPSLMAAGFTIVDQVRINFGYTAKDMVANVQTFPVANREISLDKSMDAMVLQVLGDANGALGGHIPMLMEDDPRPRRALTMIHHPKGDPLQFSSGTCQIHPRQSEIPSEASQLRHSCESTGGSSGSLLLDARSLAVVGLHNTGGLSRAGGYNGGHKIAMIEQALDIGFGVPAPEPAAKPATDPANDALLAALLLPDPAAKRAALQALIQDFPGTIAAQSADLTLAALAPAQPAAPASDPNLLIVARDGSGQYTEIADAVDAAPDGARIEVRGGNYERGFTVDKSLSIIGIDTGEGYPFLSVMDADAIIWASGKGHIQNIGMNTVGGRAIHMIDGDLWLEGGNLSNFGQDHAILVQGTSRLTVTDAEFLGCIHSCVRAVDQAFVIIQDNAFYGVFPGSDDSADPVFLWASDAASIRVNNNAFTHSRFEETGIKVQTTGKVIVTRNLFEGLTAGLHIAAGEDIEFTDNRFEHIIAPILISAGANPVIKRNEVSEHCGIAVVFEKNAAGTLIGNTIRDCRVGAIKINQGANVTIQENYLTDTRDRAYGIMIDRDVSGLISRNVFLSYGSENVAIFELTGDRTVTIRNNKF